MSHVQVSRRGFLTRAATGGLALSLGLSKVRAQNDQTEILAAKMVTPETRQAIDRALAYLAQHQREDGSFGATGYEANPAICALTGMAFLSAGNTPGRGPYGQNVRRCVEYTLSLTQDSGFIAVPGRTQHGPMYGHAFATLLLAEVYGMTARPELGQKLDSAVKLIVDSQNKFGAWRYEPYSKEEDISVTVCQIMALRAARNAGIHVPHKTVDRTIQYVKKCQHKDGGFIYQLEHGGQSAFPRSAAGVVALYSAGVYDGPEISKGLKYLMRHLPQGADAGAESHYFYGHYYAVQAMWHAGGEYWSQWYPAIRDELVKRQRDDGAWTDPLTKYNVYGAAMACIILQMPNNYLPIFQR